MSRTDDTTSGQVPLSNAEVGDRLNELAELLEAQNSNPFRVRAYRVAADTLRALQEPVPQIVERDGTAGLMSLPGIGESLARSIERLALSGELGLLNRLRGHKPASERVFTSLSGIGPKLAARIHDELGIETLADLEAAAYDGRLARVPGLGQKKIRGVRESLAGRFRRRPRVPAAQVTSVPKDNPPVAELLSVDDEYRRKAGADRLPRIAPLRLNPTGEAWLPVLHTHRGDRHYTALYSNTARAHELGMTHDWVVIYRDDHEGEGQWTVITSRLGRLQGHRIVRGREQECVEHYARTELFIESMDDGLGRTSVSDAPPV